MPNLRYTFSSWYVLPLGFLIYIETAKSSCDEYLDKSEMLVKSFEFLNRFDQMENPGVLGRLFASKADCPKPENKSIDQLNEISAELAADDQKALTDNICIAEVQNQFGGQKFIKCVPRADGSQVPEYTSIKPCVSPNYTNLVRAATIRAAKCLNTDPHKRFKIFAHESGMHLTAVSSTGALGIGQVTSSALIELREYLNDEGKEIDGASRYYEISSLWKKDPKRFRACQLFENFQNEYKKKKTWNACDVVGFPEGIFRGLYLGMKHDVINEYKMSRAVSRIFEDGGEKGTENDNFIGQNPNFGTNEERNKNKIVTEAIHKQVTKLYQDLYNEKNKKLVKAKKPKIVLTEDTILAAVKKRYNFLEENRLKKIEINKKYRDALLVKFVPISTVAVTDLESSKAIKDFHEKFSDALRIWAYNGGHGGIKASLLGFLAHLSSSGSKDLKFSNFGEFRDKFKTYLFNHYGSSKTAEARRKEVSEYQGKVEAESAKHPDCLKRTRGKIDDFT